MRGRFPLDFAEQLKREDLMVFDAYAHCVLNTMRGDLRRLQTVRPRQVWEDMLRLMEEDEEVQRLLNILEDEVEEFDQKMTDLPRKRRRRQ